MHPVQLTLCGFVAGTAIFCLAAEQPLQRAVVKGENVNLRARPSTAAEVVAQVSAPADLAIKSISNEWVEVVPPENADLWVLSDYVQEGVVACQRRVNVRAGPGINFNIVGQLTNGEPVNVRGRHGEWVKIAPPATASLWVSRALMEIPSVAAKAPAPPAPKTPPEPPARAEAKEEKPVEPPAVAVAPAVAPLPAAQPPAPPAEEKLTATTTPTAPPAKPPEQTPASGGFIVPSDLKLNPAMPQGLWRQYEGILRPRSFLIGAPSDYRLTEERNGNAFTICHVRGNQAQLRALLNRRLIVSGREYWVQRQDRPVLIPERIVIK